mgnify:FL=1
MNIGRMKTIKVRDDVYRKLVEIKGNRSFSEVIEQLLKDSAKLRKLERQKYFGILTEEEAKEIMRAIEESRRLTDERIRRISGLLDDH